MPSCTRWRRCCNCRTTSRAAAGPPVDNTPPTPLILAPANHDGAAAFVVTINWDEAVTGFDVSDITTGGPVTLSGFGGAGASYTVTATPTGDADMTFDIAAGVAQDLAGNPSLAAAQVSVINPPTVVINAPATHNTITPFFVLINFSETVTGFTIGDITIVGGTLDLFTEPSPGVVFQVRVTPGIVNITMDIAAGVAFDTDSHGNLAATQAVITAVDTQSPAVTITPDVPTHDGSTPYNILFTWDEPVFGFDVTDITISNATLSGFTQLTPTTFTVVSTPIAAVTAIFTSTAAGVAVDGAGNPSFFGGPNVLAWAP